jgi:hypothetical protein
MHILTNPKTYPYSVSQLMRDNPQTSFPKNPSDEVLAQWNVFPVVRSDQPAHDPATHRIEEGSPALVGSSWTQAWNVIALTDDEAAEQQAEHAARVESWRTQAYRTESDPLFFKSQRGEATHQEWLDKVAEIKARYPA